MVNFGPLAAEIVSLVWGTPRNFNGFRVLAALLHGTLVVGASQTAALNRGRHLYSTGRPSRWTLAHILVIIEQLVGCLCLCLDNNFLRITSELNKLNLDRHSASHLHYLLGQARRSSQSSGWQEEKEANIAMADRRWKPDLNWKQ